MSTYYVKTGGGTGTGLDDANAWSYAKYNATNVAAGSVVLFKRGDTFSGAFTTRTGSVGNIVSYGAYGSGANPIITGLQQLSTWTLSSGNIYYADFDISTNLNLVVIDGVVKTMGRYPNSGWLQYTGHTTNTVLTGPTIGTIPFDATGGEAVIRKVRYIIDRHPISAHSGTTLTLSTTTLYGGSITRAAVNNNGFFIQNHLSCLDTDGDWYYDKVAKRLYVYFTATPSGRVVETTLVDKLFTVSSKSYITFSDIDFIGSNTQGASINGGANIVFTSCNFYKHGQTALYCNGIATMSVTGGTISNCLNDGIWVEQTGTDVTIDGVTLNNIGTVAGSTRSGDGAAQAVVINGETTIVKNCHITNVGYNGINFNGSNALIQGNFIDTYCTIKDDGGGIYTYSLGVTVSNRIVQNNIVINAIGAQAGTDAYVAYENYGKACAVYLDEGANHTIVQNNFLAHGEWAGVFNNNTSTNEIKDNLIYNFSKQIWFWEFASGGIRSNVITGNTLIARTATQKTIAVKLYESDNISLFGTFDNNVYARPIDDTTTIEVYRDYSGGGGELNISLATWKATYLLDTNSVKSSITTASVNDIIFDYNEDSENLAVSLSGWHKEITGTIYNSGYELTPFTAKVLVKATVTAFTHSGKVLTHNGKILIK